jgi:predicted aspartyl protease
MPILHTELTAKGKNPDGEDVDVPPPLVLARRGPVVQVTVGVSTQMAEQLVQGGKVVPTPVSGWALFDTGSSVTCIDEKVAQKLGLPVIDSVKLASASHAETDKNVYPALIAFVGVPIRLNVNRAIGAALENQKLVALLGRDLLRSFTMFYNGVAGQVTFSMA